MPEAVSETKLLAARMQYSLAFATERGVTSVAGAGRASLRAKATGSARVGSRTQKCSSASDACFVLRSLWLSFWLAAAAKPGVDRPLFGTGVFHPPPKPGASISQTQHVRVHDVCTE